MGISERAAARAIEPVRAHAEAEVRTLVEAALVVLRRSGLDGLTVADVLSEAGLSTRAFYRSFRSKDELVLAVFEHERLRSAAQLEAAIAKARTPRRRLEAWIDQTLGLAFDPRRARRTQVLAAEGARLSREFPEEFRVIFEGELAPLVRVLDEGRVSGEFTRCEPVVDARTIHAIVWALAEMRLAGAPLTLATARRHALRFCFPALGIDS